MSNPKFEVQNSNSPFDRFVCESPEDTFALGEKFAESLRGGETVLLRGGLGAGKTLFVKGAMNALDFDVDEVTSPSFTLVNLYPARFDVYHIDLYRIERNAAFAVGLDEILENETAVVFIEWAERLGDYPLPEKTIEIVIQGDGDEPRRITINYLNQR
ncbi:MAG: tRNA (adenosine(37)-N6)-threonylcarbamoyltransferase complex ATPase subunit type 1 TsaE [Acidobacteriota bacterium]|nr:tRNA (adenosine(37)-N6)-threonylcarbamoyltransferase complex ATPase subunit type 1 TsaE [Acidobacteriota bacterium]